MDTVWMWVGFNLFVVGLLALDLGVLHRGERQITVRHALWLSLGYVVLAMIFAGGMFVFMGEAEGYQFLTGYLIEKSLSVDNIFVFVLIFSHFAVPHQYQYRVLFWGILGALVMRATLILVGAAVIDAFHWVIYLFGAFLIVTGIKMLVTVGQEPDVDNNRIVRFMRRRFRVTEGYEGNRFFVIKDKVRYMTPLFLVLILIELTDVVFALDSIPAIFAITTDPFIVYTSNVFAILGLRALYFALAGVIHRFHYLKYGLSLVLVIVGMKMVLNAWFGTKVIPTEVALLITAVLIGGSILFSIWKTRSLPVEKAEQIANQWWVPGSPPKSDSKPDGKRKS
ncbi:TerC family protein [Billgrantia saliphila]|uniref:TerC family protein n=1 Tax=Billgrantia saliphila TaxID=1848458 RepID=UPI000CE328B5|nr:TerC family protein [Halomonas saliphila]